MPFGVMPAGPRFAATGVGTNMVYLAQRACSAGELFDKPLHQASPWLEDSPEFVSIDPRDYLKPARTAMKEVCIARMVSFGQAGQADKIK